MATCVCLGAAYEAESDDYVYVIGPHTAPADHSRVRINRYYSSNSPATASWEGEELSGADWFEPNVARGNFWPHDVSCLATASPEAPDEPLVYVCGEKPGQHTSSNYFVLAWAKDLRKEIKPGHRETMPIWTREFNHQPNATFVGNDIATKIHASGNYVAVTGSSQNPDGSTSVQTMLLDRLNGMTVLPDPGLRLSYPGYIGEPVDVRLGHVAGVGDAIFGVASFRTPTFAQSFIVAQVINIGTGAELGRSVCTPVAGARVNAVAMAMEPDGLGMFIAGSQTPSPSGPSVILLLRLDVTNPSAEWVTTYSVPGGANLNHAASAMAVGRDGQLNTMFAITGSVDQLPGSGTQDMLTVLLSGVGSQPPVVRWFSIEDSAGGEDRATAIAIQPDSQLDQWRVYVTGFVTTFFGDRDWRTMMFKSPNVNGNEYPAGTIIRHDYSGPAGDDEPTAMHLSHPGLDRKFFIVGSSLHIQSAQDFYSHKYEDITP